MAKFAKRIKKLSGYTENALVVGRAFGNLGQLLEIYDSVFVIDTSPCILKSRNLIYKESFDKISSLVQIGGIFIDLDYVDKLESLEECWNRNSSTVFVEGDNYKDVRVSSIFYRTGWVCVSNQNTYHVWQKIK